MKPREIQKKISGIPYMTLQQAEYIYDHIVKNNLRDILEIGFYHGVSTCYLAGAAKEVGGKVTTIDLPCALSKSPNIHECLNMCNLQDFVSIITEPEGASWPLMKMIEDGSQFDFIYIDAAHDWDHTGFFFFLAEKILRPGGWIIFDDLDWSINKSKLDKNVDWIKKLTERQRSTPQINKVWDLLVKQHPNIGEAFQWKSWGVCKKKGPKKNLFKKLFKNAGKK